MFYIEDEILKEALLRFAPLNLMIPAGCNTSRVLLERMGVRDAITLANLIENRKWADGLLFWVLDNIKPEQLGEVEFRPIVLGPNVLGGNVQLGTISDLNKLTARVVIRPLSKGMGGDYPKVRFALFIERHIMIARNYSSLLWDLFQGAQEPRPQDPQLADRALRDHRLFRAQHLRKLPPPRPGWPVSQHSQALGK